MPLPRIALIVSGPYSGNGVVAGLLAAFLGVGHLRAEDFTRYARLKATGPSEAQAVDPSDDPLVGRSWDGYPVHHGLARVAHAAYPAAWAVSLGTEYLDAYEPLETEMATTSNLVVAIRHGSHSWRRMAAWCLGVKRKHSQATPRERAVMRALFNPARPTWTTGEDGATAATVDLTGQEQAMIEEIRRIAERWHLRLEGRSRILDLVLDERTPLGTPGDEARPTVVVTLPPFSQVPRPGLDRVGYPWFEPVDAGTRLESRVGEVPESRGAAAVFFEDFDLLVDMWTTVAVQVLDTLLGAAGYDVPAARRELVHRLGDDSDPISRAILAGQ